MLNPFNETVLFIQMSPFLTHLIYDFVSTDSTLIRLHAGFYSYKMKRRSFSIATAKRRRYIFTQMGLRSYIFPKP